MHSIVGMPCLKTERKRSQNVGVLMRFFVPTKVQFREMIDIP